MDTSNIKFEASPSEPLVDSFDGSSPSSHFPSIFDGFDNMESTLNPSDLDGSEYSFDGMEKMEMMAMGQSHPSDGTPPPQSEKKVTKKRKSWGQQLPEPKTNLPPRKRAKTEDEKEQRRVERVLRNRRAAQTSRERKRQEVEALEAEKTAIERRNKDLEMRLAEAEARNIALEQRLAQLSSASSPYNVQSSPVQQIQPSPTQVTFSQTLFPSDDSNTFQSINSQTIDPASLSPEMGPVDDASNASYADMTQHSAAVLWDLQCLSAQQRPWTTRQPTPPTFSVLLALLSTISTASSAILTPLATILSSLRTGSSLSPTPSVLSSLIWLLLTTTATPTSTSAATSTPRARPTSSIRPRFSLRMSMLRRLLACSPHLARPLMDATMSAMRSASEQLARVEVCDGADAGEDSRSGVQDGGPSVEALATLLWAIHVWEREHQRGGRGAKMSYVVKRAEAKRGWETPGELLGLDGRCGGHFERAFGGQKS